MGGSRRAGSGGGGRMGQQFLVGGGVGQQFLVGRGQVNSCFLGEGWVKSLWPKVDRPGQNHYTSENVTFTRISHVVGNNTKLIP